VFSSARLKRIIAFGIIAKARLLNRRSVKARRRAITELAKINAFEMKIYGEDGMLREIFTRIPHRRYFVEIGVENGEECNTALLSRHYHWRGLMIEGNADHESVLRDRFAPLGVDIEAAFVDRDNIARIFERHNVPRDLDLLSIDIDGNDLFVWQALEAYKASCVVIEYNAFWGPLVSRSIAYDATRRFQQDTYFGCEPSGVDKRRARARLRAHRYGLSARQRLFHPSRLARSLRFPGADA